MTDEQMRIAIAEACGWIHHHMRPSETERHQKKWRYLSDLPNYLNDLNACAEFEAMLTSAERFTYIVELNKLCGDEPSAVWATARQRCIAYLKTKGLIP